MKTTAFELLSFIKEATSPYHVVEQCRQMLSQSGFNELNIESPWTLETGKSYFVIPYGTSLFAFTVGARYQAGDACHIAAAHTDYPCLRLKPSTEQESNEYLKLNVEVYGGPIINTWLDRPLSVAGRVMLKSEDPYHPHSSLFDAKKPLLTIPNLAIHMNPEINKGVELNKQTDLSPFFGMLTASMQKETFFKDYLADQLQVTPSEILDYDIYIYNAEEGCMSGFQEEFISSPRLDNLSSVFACIQSIINKKTDNQTTSDYLNFVALYDNEEVGSRSKQGADSLLTTIILEKIYLGLGFNPSQMNESIFKSFLLSVDTAHAYHPNYPGKNDPSLIAKCNHGIVLKYNTNQKYATDTEAMAIIKQLCQVYDIPFQEFANRSDLPGGTTLGSITSSYLPMKTVDLGVPLLAMHSSREFMGSDDEATLIKLLSCFFS